MYTESICHTRVARGPCRPNIIVCGLRGLEILAGLDDNRDDVFNCHEVRIEEYLRQWNLVSTYLCLQKFTPIKGFPCLSVVSNLQSVAKIFMRDSCGPNNLVAGRGYKFRPASNSVSYIPLLQIRARASEPHIPHPEAAGRERTACRGRRLRETIPDETSHPHGRLLHLPAGDF